MPFMNTVFGFPQTIAELRTVWLGAQTEAQFIIRFYVSRRITLRSLRLSPPTTIVVIVIIVSLYYSSPVLRTFCSLPVYTMD
jgi:hypothetical protein